MESITIGSTVSEIYRNPFLRCPSLTSINLPENSPFVFEDGMLMNKEKSTLYVYLESNTRENVILPSTITLIQNRALNTNDYILLI